MALLAFALGGLWLSPTPSGADPAAPGVDPDDPFETGETIRLPEGRLQLVSGTDEVAFFIALDLTKRSGDRVNYWVYGAYVPGYAMAEGPVVQEFSRLSIDCKARTVRTWGATGFLESGRVVVSLPARGFKAGPIEEGSAYDFQARVLCDGVQMPASNTMMGHAQALAVARIMLKPKSQS
jgi:hypothetical protein